MKPYFRKSGITLYQGKVEDVLPQLSGAFDACLCDPPYGLTANKRGGSGPASVNLRHPGGRARVTTGFMGMAWDGIVPGPRIWASILRALQPGAPLLAFGGARTFHRLACAIEDAGFLLADTICWLYGQGFPKGHTQLKPAWEPVTLAWRKGKRTLAIEAARIGYERGGTLASNPSLRTHIKGGNGGRIIATEATNRIGIPSGLGRWPANVILDEESAAALDEQSGILTSGNNPAKRSADKHRTVYAGWKGEQCLVHRGTDSGGASRFFYCAKASRKERGEGNTHPTVKPLKLTEYLARLILPPKRDTPRRLLIPFSGSGSEILGALAAGWDEVVAIERDRSYCDMTIARIAPAKPKVRAA